jgi:hypothetical protein
MKKSLLIVLALFSVSAFAVETQKVCHEKNGKTVCKLVKIHKPIADATPVPIKKK